MIFQIESGKLIDVVDNPNQSKYVGEKVFVIEFNGYAYVMPFIEREYEIFLKTVFPSRKMTKKYLEKE